MSSGANRFEASVPATAEAISALTDKVMAFLEREGVETRPTHHTALVLSELLTNLGTHGGCRDKAARIVVVVGPDKVTGEVIDRGPPFDPTLAPDPTLDLSVSERPIGGLGLYLVRKLSCTLEYTRRNDENCLMFAVSRADGA